MVGNALIDSCSKTVTDREKQQAVQVYQVLLDYFGYPEWGGSQPPLDELINTILSQNTNDLNRDRAYNRLRERFHTWEDVRDAEESEVVEAIRTAGLANQKGPRIQTVLKEITSERGGLDLTFLQELPTDEARHWLSRFKGVGPKTTAIVLLFSLGKPAFPVDTHVYRVSGRLGLRPEKMSVEQAHTHLAGLFPEEGYGPAHLNLIRLGREICDARKPDCLNCPLKRCCNFYLRQSAGVPGTGDQE